MGIEACDKLLRDEARWGFTPALYPTVVDSCLDGGRLGASEFRDWVRKGLCPQPLRDPTRLFSALEPGLDDDPSPTVVIPAADVDAVNVLPVSFIRLR